jgi:nucleotide-binding universal stress UspA family protein
MKNGILVPLDGSPVGETILPPVLPLARATGAAVTLLRVVPSPLLVHPVTGMAPAPSIRRLGYIYDLEVADRRSWAILGVKPLVPPPSNFTTVDPKSQPLYPPILAVG